MLQPQSGMKIHAYVNLSKPGIIFGNIISLTGGFLLGSYDGVHWLHGIMLSLGAMLVIASGCAVNNVIDRDIDALMIRTRQRPMVGGAITVTAAIVYAAVSLLAGAGLFYIAAASLLPLALLMLGYVIYAGLYTFCMKRHSVHGTLVGSIAGAMPPVAGYCAASGSFDGAALLLLLMFSLWQMPHSYAIAIFREDDYRAASIPVLPVVYGISTARRHILFYMIAFMVVAPALTLFGYAGKFYLFASTLGSAYWLWLGIQGFKAKDEVQWARRVFIASIILVTVLCVAMGTPV